VIHSPVLYWRRFIPANFLVFHKYLQVIDLH
jgi:hypothetical protein